MKIVVQRNQKDFGPYPVALVQTYMAQGSLLPQDLARLEGTPASAALPLSQLLAQAGVVSSPAVVGNPFQVAVQNLRSFDFRLLFPWKTISSFAWSKDRKLMYLAGAGLAPALALAMVPGVWLSYWAIALYFSFLWAVFFYYLFKTPQVKPRLCGLAFIFTAIASTTLVLVLQRIPPWTVLYAMARSEYMLPRLLGMFLGVGVHEELAKAIILFWLVRRPGNLLIPQTVVFYGMMAGLGFGIYEGVCYQLGVNREQGIDQAYLLNIARLTSLPFLHAVWTGIAGYFISFSALYPKKRYGLWVLAIAVPAIFHAIYNTFGWGVIGFTGAFLSVILLTTYLTNVLQMQQQLRAP